MSGFSTSGPTKPATRWSPSVHWQCKARQTRQPLQWGALLLLSGPFYPQFPERQLRSTRMTVIEWPEFCTPTACQSRQETSRHGAPSSEKPPIGMTPCSHILLDAEPAPATRHHEPPTTSFTEYSGLSRCRCPSISPRRPMETSCIPTTMLSTPRSSSGLPLSSSPQKSLSAVR